MSWYLFTKRVFCIPCRHLPLISPIFELITKIKMSAIQGYFVCFKPTEIAQMISEGSVDDVVNCKVIYSI